MFLCFQSPGANRVAPSRRLGCVTHSPAARVPHSRPAATTTGWPIVESNTRVTTGDHTVSLRQIRQRTQQPVMAPFSVRRIHTVPDIPSAVFRGQTEAQWFDEAYCPGIIAEPDQNHVAISQIRELSGRSGRRRRFLRPAPRTLLPLDPQCKAAQGTGELRTGFQKRSSAVV